MVLARVLGTVWGAKQSPGLDGRRIVEVQQLNLGQARNGDVFKQDTDDEHFCQHTMLAVDTLGADEGQLVLLAIGSRIRDIGIGPHVETKHSIIAIVDAVSLEGLPTGLVDGRGL